MRAKHDQKTAPLFGDGLLPAVALPFHGYLAEPEPKWLRFCEGYYGFNAYLPASWCDAYVDRLLIRHSVYLSEALSRAWGEWRVACQARKKSLAPASWCGGYTEAT